MVRWKVSTLTSQPRTFEQQDLRILRTKYNVQQAAPWVVTMTMPVRFLCVAVGLSLHQWIDRWRSWWIGWTYARRTRREEDEFGAWRRDMTWMCTKRSDLWTGKEFWDFTFSSSSSAEKEKEKVSLQRPHDSILLLSKGDASSIEVRLDQNHEDEIMHEEANNSPLH